MRAGSLASFGEEEYDLSFGDGISSMCILKLVDEFLMRAAYFTLLNFSDSIITNIASDPLFTSIKYLELRMLLNFQKRMREAGAIEVTTEQYVYTLDEAIDSLALLKEEFGTPEGLDEEDWIISYGTARLFMMIGYIRGMWDPKAPFRKNDRLTPEIFVEMGWAEQKELEEMFKR